MDINTLYYTLSTISQTLASIVALAAVFIILILEILIRNINDYKSRAINILKRKNEYTKDIVDFTNTLEVLKEIKKINESIPSLYEKNVGMENAMDDLASRYETITKIKGKEFIQITYNNLDVFIEQRDQIINLIKYPGILTVSVIGISILFLSMADFIKNNTDIACILFFIVPLTLFTLYSLTRALWKILTFVKLLM